MHFSNYETSLGNVLDDFGVVTWRQLVSAGLSGRQVKRLVTAGQLIPGGRGVYCTPASRDLGAAWRQRARAALLAAGDGATLARSSAAILWDLDGFRLHSRGPASSASGHGGHPASWRLELNTRCAGGRGVVGVRRVRDVEPVDRIDGLAVSGIGQTLLELGASDSGAAIAKLDRVELALESALRRQLICLEQLQELEASVGPHHGVAMLRKVLGRRPAGAAPTESYLETRTVQLLRDAGFADPQRQVELFDRRGRVGRFDFLLRPGRGRVAAHGGVIIEVDGRETHDNDPAFVIDRVRWNRLTALGLRPLVLTYQLVEGEAALVALLVRETLALVD